MRSITSHNRWTPRTILHRAIQVTQDDGLVTLWFKILGEWIYRRVVVIERFINEEISEVSARVPLVFGWLDGKQIDEYLRLRPDATRTEIVRRLSLGQACLIARCNGQIVHAGWSTAGRARIDYLERDIQLAPDEMYIFEAFTAPDYRGANIPPAVSAYRCRYFGNLGYRRFVAVVVPENQRALRSFQKAGYRICGTMGSVGLGTWRWNFSRRNALRAPMTSNLGKVLDRMKNGGHYLDPFLANLKKQMYVRLIDRWGGAPRLGLTLKTDLFEEATGLDAFFLNVVEEERAIGIDLSPVVAVRAKEKAPCAKYLAADARQLPFASHSFALIISPSTLDHFADPADLERSLRELSRLLVPGGRLIVTLDNRQNIFDPLLRLANRLGCLPYYVGHSLTMSELTSLLETIGLQIMDTTAILHNPRLLAVAAKRIVNKIGWRPLILLIERWLIAAQKFEHTRWRYRTGSFIAALAVKPQNIDG
jgi:SAM-dependent methyltransferase/ribosomal protein S18 acetylase RimI-like enzyme